MFHTVAYTNPTVKDTDGYEAQPAIMDGIFATSGNGLLMPCDLRLIAAYAGGTTITKARVNAPSLLRVGYPSIRPIQKNTDGKALNNPAFMTMLDSPLAVRSSEAIGIDSATSNTSDEVHVGLLWLADYLQPVPAGESFWLRFSASATLTALKWTAISPTYDQAIPSGTYAVIGLEFTSTTAIAARVIFPGSVFRPGVLAQNLAAPNTVGTARTHQAFYDGSFGVWGMFQTNAPPNIEVFAISADTAQEGYLRVVRIGDIGASPMLPTGRMLPPATSPAMTTGGAAPTLTPSPYGAPSSSGTKSPYGTRY